MVFTPCPKKRQNDLRNSVTNYYNVVNLLLKRSKVKWIIMHKLIKYLEKVSLVVAWTEKSHNKGLFSNWRKALESWHVISVIKIFLDTTPSPVLSVCLCRRQSPRVTLAFTVHLGHGRWLHRSKKVTLIDPSTALGASRSFSSHPVVGWILDVPHSPRGKGAVRSLRHSLTRYGGPFGTKTVPGNVESFIL